MIFMAANKIEIKIYTYKDISDIVYAKYIAEYCKKMGIYWDKVDDKEPLRKVYDDEQFFSCWTNSKVTWVDENAKTYYSCVFCRQSKDQLSLFVNWKNSVPPKHSYLIFEAPYKKFCYQKEVYEKFFYFLIEVFEADYACIANRNFWLDCHRGFPKIPFYQDIHWITYISSQRKNEMTAEIDNFPWNKRIDTNNGSAFYICDYIPKDGDPIEKKCLEYRSMLWGIR